MGYKKYPLGEQLARMFTFRSPFGDTYQVCDSAGNICWSGNAGDPQEALALARKANPGKKMGAYRRFTGMVFLPWIKVK